LGISGLRGHYPESQSALSRSEEEWLEQVKLIDQHFERLLADLIMGVINHALDENKGNKSHRFIIQGPAFPKLLGRLAYRRILDQAAVNGVFFMTFRRRFLMPHPMMADGAPASYLTGPIPSVHEHSLAKKYYLLPDIKKEETDGLKPDIPLMIEVFEHPSKPERAMDAFKSVLNDLGVQRVKGTESYMVDHADADLWELFPSLSSVLQKVPAPRRLLEANRRSLEEMNVSLNTKWSNAAIDLNSVRNVLKVLNDKGKNLTVEELFNRAVGRVAARSLDNPAEWLHLFNMSAEELRRNLDRNASS